MPVLRGTCGAQRGTCVVTYTPMHMTKCDSLASARSQLADVVDGLEARGEIELMRRGMRVAVLVSAIR